MVKRSSVVTAKAWVGSPAWETSHAIGTEKKKVYIYIYILKSIYIYKYIYIYFFFVFLPFLGPFPQHMEVPRLGVQSEL